MENWAWDWLSGARGSRINRLAQACANLYEKCVWEPPNTKKRDRGETTDQPRSDVKMTLEGRAQAAQQELPTTPRRGGR